MLNTVRLYFDAALAVAIMATFGAIMGFAAGAITGDRTTVITATATGFILTGIVLAVRLWRTTRKPVPLNPGI
jgi:uncharacterized membrane protein (UPF0136 family)